MREYLTASSLWMGSCSPLQSLGEVRHVTSSRNMLRVWNSHRVAFSFVRLTTRCRDVIPDFIKPRPTEYSSSMLRCEMAQNSLQNSVHQIGTERQHFLEIVREVSVTIGTEFFSMLVRHLRRALGAGCVYVCEFMGRQNERARTLAACMEGDRMETFELPMAGSPDAEVALRRPYMCAK